MQKVCLEKVTDLFLSRAPKSREVDSALALAKQCIAEHRGPLPSVPLHLRNAPTRLMKDLGKFMNSFTPLGFVFVKIWS
jgi:putative ATPase